MPSVLQEWQTNSRCSSVMMGSSSLSVCLKCGFIWYVSTTLQPIKTPTCAEVLQRGDSTRQVSLTNSDHWSVSDWLFNQQTLGSLVSVCVGEGDEKKCRYKKNNNTLSQLSQGNCCGVRPSHTYRSVSESKQGVPSSLIGDSRKVGFTDSWVGRGSLYCLGFSKMR